MGHDVEDRQRAAPGSNDSDDSNGRKGRKSSNKKRAATLPCLRSKIAAQYGGRARPRKMEDGSTTSKI